MDEQKPFLLKITFDDLPNEIKQRLNFLIFTLLTTLFILNVLIITSIVLKLHNVYNLFKNWLHGNYNLINE